LGDVRAARACVARLTGREASVDEPLGLEQSDEEKFTERVLDALLATANGDFPAAISLWRALHETSPHDATITQNLAVCLIYVGRMVEAKDLFEALIDEKETPAFQPLLFNLCTVYELCTGKANEEKAKLVERVAAKEPGEEGWEKASVEFKL
jgi:lipoprotein NlpI